MIQGSTASLGDEGTNHDLGHMEVPNSFATIQTTYGGNMATLVQHGLSVPKVPNLGMRGSYLKGGSNVKKGQSKPNQDRKNKMKFRKSAFEDNSTTFNILKVLS